MITPRSTRLVRAERLDGWQEAILAACPDDAAEGRATLVIVPTQSAARRLGRVFAESHPTGGREPRATPDILTRDGIYEQLLTSIGAGREWLTPYDRETALEHAAHAAITDGIGPPFHLRPRLLGEMLELYDELLRHQQSVDDFERLLEADLQPQASTDRGAERLLRQTRFLAAAFRGYERQLRERNALDEHELRALLLSGTAASPWRRILVTVGDRAAERGGLWPADFDLLTRFHGIAHLLVFATEAQLAAGFHTRIHDLLPGIEEERFKSPLEREPPQPALMVPAATRGDRRHFVSRDREEELADAIRRMSDESGHDETRAPADLSRVAVVFARPLPYLYLAREVFASAGLRFQCDDMLPLAAEPVAAAVDLALTFVSTGGGREATIALLRSPHFVFAAEGTRGEWDASVAALDAMLRERGGDGGAETLETFAAELARAPAGEPDRATRRRHLAARAARAAADAAAQLAPLFRRASAVTQLETLLQFLDGRQPPEASLTGRERRARSAVRAILAALIRAARVQPALTWDIEQLAASVRRWMEAHTFQPRSGDGGVHLADALAARYGAFDEVHLVGLIEGEWPERRRRNIFYSPFLLRKLGWKDEGTAADRAAFFDLLRLARRRTFVSTVQLENEALVEPSAFLDELHAPDLTAVPWAPERPRAFLHEALLSRAQPLEGLSADAKRWLNVRTARRDAGLPEFHGQARPAPRPEYGVGSIELYTQCPFKYFARYVLELEEEQADADGISPRDRGVFVHEVLQAFFERWQASGRGAIGPVDLDAARSELEATAAPMLGRLGAVDAVLERARLFGSAAAPGIGDLVLRMEAERPTAIVGRRMEERFRGVFALQDSGGMPRQVPIRGVVDRIDLLADGSLRVLDYKSQVPPAPLQLAIYAVTAAQRVSVELGRVWRVGEAAYVVYGGRREVRSLAGRGRDLADALTEATRRFVAAVDAIETGAFGARPVQTRLCATCAFAAVCRKDYVTPAESGDGPAAV